MTYRLDSDIPWLYGWVENKSNKNSTSWANMTRVADDTVEQVKELNKNKLVAWAVSNCHTRSRWG